jgi:hypothetical protein
VETFSEQVLGSSEQSTCNYDNRGGSIASLNILRFADFNKLKI